MNVYGERNCCWWSGWGEYPRLLATRMRIPSEGFWYLKLQFDDGIMALRMEDNNRVIIEHHINEWLNGWLADVCMDFHFLSFFHPQRPANSHSTYSFHAIEIVITIICKCYLISFYVYDEFYAFLIYFLSSYFFLEGRCMHAIDGGSFEQFSLSPQIL